MTWFTVARHVRKLIMEDYMALTTLPFPLDELRREQADNKVEKISEDTVASFSGEIVAEATDSIISFDIDNTGERRSDSPVAVSDSMTDISAREVTLEPLCSVDVEPVEGHEERSETPMASEVLAEPVESHEERSETPMASEILAHKMQQMLNQWQETYPQFESILVATADGSDIASVVNGENKENIQRLAIMSGSMLALSGNMLSEMDAGGQNVLMLEGEYGYVFIHKVTTGDLELSLMVMARTGELLGKLFWLLRQLNDEILGVCTAVADIS
jgi:predicted regulator of Ras-like GTPase activity (Roadblock/LC7/MglB family)